MNSTLTATEGSLYFFSCELTGGEVQWSKDGTNVSSYNGQVWLFKVSVSDEGEYTCSNGHQTLNYLLLVQGR